MDLEKFPVSPAARRMLTYVTKNWYEDSYVGKWVYEAMGREIDEAERFLLELADQFFVGTATWGLRYHELKYGLEVREALTYEERRALIVEKRDLRHPMNPARMENVLRERFGVEVHVNDMNDPGDCAFEHPNVFSVTFIQNGNENAINIQQAKRLIQKLKLSHTICALKYGHSVWVRFEEPDYGMNVIFSAGVVARDKRQIGIEERLLDGSWLLDGSILLDEEEHPWEAKELHGIGVVAMTKVPQRLSVGFSVGQSMNFLIDSRADGSMELSGKAMSGSSVELPETEILMEVSGADKTYDGEIEVKEDFWQLDGSVPLDGSRALDAEEYIVKL